VPGLEGARPEQLSPRARTVGADGEVFLLFPVDSPAVRAATHAQADELSAVLEIVDVAPVAVPDRVRGRALISGWLTSAPGLATEPGSMMLSRCRWPTTSSRVRGRIRTASGLLVGSFSWRSSAAAVKRSGSTL
jgi:hypothetical protein